MSVVGAIVVVVAPALLAVWAVVNLARSLTRKRRLPPTRHARRIQLDLWG
jgi:hypothetical protein